MRRLLISTTIMALAAQSAGAASCSGTGIGTGNSKDSFGILPAVKDGVGQIFSPNGQPFYPRGVGVMEGQQQPSASDLQASMPGLNFVRYAIYNYASPETLAPYVNQLTAAGIVVEIEDHNNGAGNAGGGKGVIFTGQQLATESGWYASLASYFKGNPYVWFGTNNEPSEKLTRTGPNNPAALSGWQLQTYAAIRDTGNSSPILIEMNGWGDPASFGEGYDPAAYANMYNVAWDIHYYGWLTNYSKDQGKNDAFLAAAVAQAQKITSAGGVKMPVIIGEYGDSTDGVRIDANAKPVIKTVQKAAQSGLVAGTAAWVWAYGTPGDGLLGNGGLSAYGRQVAAFIAKSAPASAACSAVAMNAPAGNSLNVDVSPPDPAPPAPNQNVQTPAVPTVDLQPSIAAGQADAASVIQGAAASVAAQVAAQSNGAIQ